MKFSIEIESKEDGGCTAAIDLGDGSRYSANGTSAQEAASSLISHLQDQRFQFEKVDDRYLSPLGQTESKKLKAFVGY